MVESLCHEPFYTSGTWIDADKVCMWDGWRGADPLPMAMPLRNESGDVTLVFSGEEFPEPGTVAGLRARGHQVEPHGPSYLVHRYEEEADFPKGLNGRFHGLLADRARGTAMLFNDRFGLQRLYYHEAKDTFYFAAEAKAILKVRPELRATDPRGLGEFIVCGCVLENRTSLFGHPRSASRRGLVLSAAECWRRRPLTSSRANGKRKNLSNRRNTIASCVMFSCGICRAISMGTSEWAFRSPAAWIRASSWRGARQSPIRCPVTRSGACTATTRTCNWRAVWQRFVASQHQVITTGNEFLSKFAHYAERSIYLTDACVDLSRSPDLYVNEKAREIAPVRMVGTYGSEMLLHAVMFKAEEPAAGLFQPRSVAADP